ncbi:tyrosine-type recombinase/integrase, partial [Deltaproteobacteria bacterium TL4]
VVRLSRHYGRAPDQLTAEEIRTFFVHLKRERQLSESSFKQYATGIKFFYEKTLGRQWELFDLVRPAKGRKLPFALPHEEVKTFLSQVRLGDCRMALTLIYACGLRISECVFPHIGDIDGKAKMLRIVGAQGNKDRYVPIPGRTLELLRLYWLQYRPKFYLFPSPRNPQSAMHVNRLQKVFKTVVHESKRPHQKATVHTLRHSYATHLLNHGVDLKTLMLLLGHNSISTTLSYTHMTESKQRDLREAIDQLMSDL